MKPLPASEHTLRIIWDVLKYGATCDIQDIIDASGEYEANVANQIVSLIKRGYLTQNGNHYFPTEKAEPYKHSWPEAPPARCPHCNHELKV